MLYPMNPLRQGLEIVIIRMPKRNRYLENWRAHVDFRNYLFDVSAWRCWTTGRALIMCGILQFLHRRGMGLNHLYE
jgi:hypothetical protein